MNQNLWWTGKDSNLRNSQGVTDLQSVGFNHSPTCPLGRICPAANVTTEERPQHDWPAGTSQAQPRVYQKPASGEMRSSSRFSLASKFWQSTCPKSCNCSAEWLL